MGAVSRDAFDSDAYLAANPDVLTAIQAGIFKSGWHHYRRLGYREGRALHPEAFMSRGEKLCVGLNLASMTGVEIGPLTTPVVRKDQGSVLYIDHTDTGNLRRKYLNDSKIDRDQIVHVDRVWGMQTLQECVGSGVAVDYVIASHVMEHVPDVVTWLQEIAAILRPGGTVRLAVPDRRYTFDILRTESTLADALDAYIRRTRIPLPRAILDHFLNYAAIDAASAWAGQLDEVRTAYTPEHALRAAEQSFREGNYQDTHCWVLTPLSFARLGAALARLNLLPLACERIYPTSSGQLEFIIILRSGALNADCVASWDCAARKLEADQGNIHEGEFEYHDKQHKSILARLQALLRRRYECFENSRSFQ